RRHTRFSRDWSSDVCSSDLRSFWDWEDMLKLNANGFFPYTPATNLLYGLREAIAMLLEEGLDEVFARHQRLAEATRAAVQHWGQIGRASCRERAESSVGGRS